MIAQLFDDLVFVLEIGRILSADYFHYNPHTKTFETDHRISTQLIIAVRIIVLTLTISFSLPSFAAINLTTVLQTMENVTTFFLCVTLFIVNYNCQEYTVRTYKALMNVEKLCDAPLSDNFKRSLKRLLWSIVLCFAIIVLPPFLFCAWNNVIDLLLVLIALMALVSFYKTLFSVTTFLLIWNYFLAINRSLEKAMFNSKICSSNKQLNTIPPKEKLCKRHLIQSLRRVHKNLTDICDLWNKAVGIPEMIIYGALFVQGTDLILMVFEAIRGGLQYSSLVRLSFSAATVGFAGFMCVTFTYCAALTRHAYARTGRILHRLYLHSNDRDAIVEEINIFSLQILLKPLVFTANDMFQFDWNLILLAGHGAITLTVIGMQFIISSA